LVEWVAVGMIAGQLAAGLDGRTLAILIALGIVGVGLSLLTRRAGPVVLATVLAAAVGCVLVMRTTAAPDDPADVAQLPLPLRGHVIGRVASIPIVDRQRVTNHPRGGVRLRARALHGRVRLRIGGPIELTRGDVIGVETTLRRPRNFENPGRFDVVAAFARRGVHVTGSVWEADDVERIGIASAPPCTRAIDAWRARVRDVLGRLGDSRVAGVLLALVARRREAESRPSCGRRSRVPASSMCSRCPDCTSES
jgi:predicted membrane metal-binding protein